MPFSCTTATYATGVLKSLVHSIFVTSSLLGFDYKQRYAKSLNFKGSFDSYLLPNNEPCYKMLSPYNPASFTCIFLSTHNSYLFSAEDKHPLSMILPTTYITMGIECGMLLLFYTTAFSV